MNGTVRPALRGLSDTGGQPVRKFQEVRGVLRGAEFLSLHIWKAILPMSGRPPILRRHAWSLTGALAAAMLVPALDWQVFAEDRSETQQSGSSSRSKATAAPAEKTVSLNHLSATWPEVLQKLADGTDSTLEMDEEPPGKFSRHDWKKHTRREAVRILNRDLEKVGYRIIEKEQFLKVVRLQKLHVDYPRPVIGDRRAPVIVKEVIGEESEDTLENGIRVVSHEQPGKAGTQSGKTPSRTSAPASPLRKELPAAKPIRDTRVRQIQLEESAEDPPVQVAAPESQTTATFKPTRRKATDIARQIHTAFGELSQLTDAGPNDLPGFVMTPKPVEGAAQASVHVEIDSDRNELVITAPQNLVASVESLMRTLDRLQTGRGQATQLVAGHSAEVAEKLQPQLTELIQERRTAPKRSPRQELAQVEQDAVPAVSEPTEVFEPAADGSKSAIEAEGPQPGAMDEEGPGNLSAQEQLPGLLDTLKGDVTLEAMPDLDLLILRGNEKDVEAVMRVIRTIEQMAEGSTPEIHLRTLEHVDSQSLATLLTQVYERMTTLRGTTANKSDAQVSAIPVVTPNAVLILSPANALPSVLKLIEELDKQVDPLHQVEVFPLENAIASQVVTTLNEFYPNDATQRPGLSTRIRVSADARTNSVIVQAQPRDMEEVRKVIERIDQDTAGAVAQARMVKLKSANATELAQFLTQTLQSILTGQSATGTGGANTGAGAGGQNAQQLRETKSVVLEFMAQDQMAQELVRSGLLTDVRVNADARTNSLMVTAPKQSMAFMVELIRVLDQPSTAVAEIKVFTLKNADAVDAVTLLEGLFAEDNTAQNTTGVGVQLAGATDPGSNLVPIKFSTDGRTNSVIAMGGVDALRIVEAVLLRLDDNDARNRSSEVIKLRNNPAADIATSVNQYLQSQRDIAQIDPDRVSSSQLIEQEVIVTAEPLSNSLIISATPRYREQIMRLIEELDREPQQVAIQALLVEVTLQDNDEFGVELGFQDSILFDRSVIDNIQSISETSTAPNGVQTTTQRIISQSSTPGYPFNNLPLGNNTSPAIHPSKVGTQGLSNFSLGRTNSDLGYGGLVLSASSDSVNVLIRALSARRNVRVLSRPSVTVLDNQVAQIQVGQIVPVTDGANIGANGNVIPTISRDNAGVILTVTPRLSQDGQVVMVVAAEKSQYTGAGVTILTDTNGGEVTSPIKDITTASTTVKVPDGQTIVMGGMITNSEDSNERKVPWLGDIPLIGQAFRYDSFVHKRTELLIFLTPRIIRCDEDMEQLKQIEAQRLHWFEDEAELIHGPIFGVPGENTTWEAPGVLQPRPQYGSTIETAPAPEQAGPTALPDSQEMGEPQPIQQMKGEVPARRRTTAKPRGLFKSSR